MGKKILGMAITNTDIKLFVSCNDFVINIFKDKWIARMQQDLTFQEPNDSEKMVYLPIKK
jgi:hypothetical protein